MREEKERRREGRKSGGSRLSEKEIGAVTAAKTMPRALPGPGECRENKKKKDDRRSPSENERKYIDRVFLRRNRAESLNEFCLWSVALRVIQFGPAMFGTVQPATI